MAKNDFKLKVGLDTSTVSIQDINADIKVIEGKVQPITVKVSASQVDTTVLTQTINSINLPPVKLNVQADPDSLQNMIDGITQKLDLKFNPTNPRRVRTLAPDDGYTGRQLSAFNKADDILRKMWELQDVSQTTEQVVVNAYKQIASAIEDARSAEDFDRITKDIQDMDNMVKSLQSRTFDTREWEKAADALRKIGEMYATVVAAEGSEPAANFTPWGFHLAEMKQELSKIFSYEHRHVFSEDTVSHVREIVSDMKGLESSFNEVYKTTQKTTFKPLDAEKTIIALEKAKESLRKLDIVDTNETQQIDALITTLERWSQADGLLKKSAFSDSDVQIIQNLQEELGQLFNTIERIKREAGAEFFDISLIHKFEKTKQDLERYVADNGKLLSNDELKSTYEYLKQMTYFDYGASKEGVEKYATALDRFKASVKEAGLESKTFAQTVKELFAGITLSGIISRLGDRLMDVFRDAVDNVKTLDTAMTELKKVTDESSASYSRFMSTAKAQAQEVGATLSDVIYSTADFARLGYSIEEATELSRVSTIYKNVGDGFESVTESSEALISIIKAFNLEASDAIAVADRLNNIGNNNAISSGGLGRALQNSASALSAAGASMDEAMALISGANSVTQDPEKVGNAMRTIALRIRSTAVELEEMGEDATGAAESTSKLREQVMALTNVDGAGGVDIMLDENNYKGIYQILEEIAAVWADIEDVDAAALLELLAGKNRANVLAGLLSNFSDAQEALDDAMHAEGSALAENGKILNSLQGKLNQFEAAWESLSNTIINSNFLKFLVDSGTSLLTILEKIIDKSGALSTLLGIAGGAIGLSVAKSPSLIGTSNQLSLKDMWSDMALEFSFNNDKKTSKMQQNALNKAQQDVEAVKAFYKAFTQADNDDAKRAAVGLLRDVGDEAIVCANKLRMLTDARDADKTVEDLNDSLTDAAMRLKGVTLASKVATVAKQALTSAVTSLGAAIVGMALDWVIDKFREWWITSDELTERFQEMKSELSTLYDNQGEFEDLAQEFEKLNSNTRRSGEETERYYEVSNRLKDLLPSLKGYYDASGNFIIQEIDSVEDLIAKYEEALRAQAELNAKSYVNDETTLGSTMQTDDLSKVRELENETIELDQLRQAVNHYLSSGDYSQVQDIVDSGNSTSVEFLNKYFDSSENQWNIDAIAADLRAKTDELNTAISNYQKEAIAALAGDSTWNTYSKEQQQAITEFIASLGIDDTNKLYDDLKDGADGYINYILAEFGITIDELVSKAKSAVTNVPTAPQTTQKVIEEFSVAEEHMDTFVKAFDEIADSGSIAATTLSEIGSIVGTNSESYQNFLDVVSNGSSTTADLQNGIRQLVQAYISDLAVLKGVNSETVGLVAAMLEQLGVTNAEEVALKALNAAEDQEKQQLADIVTAREKLIDVDIATLTKAEAEALLEQGDMSEYAAQMVAYLALQKIGCSSGGFAEAIKHDAEMVRYLGKKARWTAEQIAGVARIQEHQATMATLNPNDLSYLEETAALTAKINEESKALLEIPAPEAPDTADYDAFWNAYKAGAKKATGDVADAFQNMYDELQFMREANLISEAEYLSRLAQLNEQYNRNNLATYRKYALEIFNTMKSAMSDRISSQYDAEIDALEAELDAYDDQIDALNEQREETEKYYDGLIEAEQEKLDLLKEEWETEEYLLKIEQARMALARAQQQKNVRVYREGQGFVWENDQQEVNDLRAEVNSAIQEYNRYLQELAIEKRIDEIEELKEKAIESIEAQIKAIEKAKEAVQKAIEAAQKAKEQALKDLEDLKLNGETFLMFCEMFGIEITDDIRAIADSFDQLGQEGELDLKKVQDAAGKTTDALTPLLDAKLDDDSAFNTMGEAMENLNTASTDFATTAQEYLDLLYRIAEESPPILEAEGNNWKDAFDKANEALGAFKMQQLDVYPGWVEEMTRLVGISLDDFTTKVKSFAAEMTTSLLSVMRELNNLTMMITGEGTGIEIPDVSSGTNGDVASTVNPDGPVVDNVGSTTTSIEGSKQTSSNIKTVKDAIDKLVEAFVDLRDILEALPEKIDAAIEKLQELQENLQKTTEEAENATAAIEALGAAVTSLPTSHTITINVHTNYTSSGSAPDIKGLEKVGQVEIDQETGNPQNKPFSMTDEEVKQSIHDALWAHYENKDNASQFASGVINLPRSVNALTDELGPELIIPGKGTFRKLKMGTSVLPADISRNLWAIGQNPIGFASGVASMISNKKEENKVYQMTFGNIELPNVHNARDFTNELKSLVLKAEQLAFSK